jgi:hypothetical protein
MARSFTSVAAMKNLYLCEKIVPRIAPALQEIIGGQNDRSVTHPREYILEGLQPSGPLKKS